MYKNIEEVLDSISSAPGDLTCFILAIGRCMDAIRCLKDNELTEKFIKFMPENVCGINPMAKFLSSRGSQPESIFKILNEADKLATIILDFFDPRIMQSFE